MYRFICKILLIILLFSNLISIVDAEIVEGFITKVDTINNKISIDDKTYKISKDCFIRFNNNPVTINGLRPVYSNYYKWVIVNINGNLVMGIDSYYKVVEGEIKEVSLVAGWLTVSQFQQDSNSNYESLIEKYYFPEKFNTILKSYKKNGHIVMVTALDRLLYLPLTNNSI